MNAQMTELQNLVRFYEKKIQVSMRTALQRSLHVPRMACSSAASNFNS